ncbi:MAG TPA: hypothetical protein VJ301_12060, partial [Propionibacteriaceae bacterium]|nr:hypothetical protein [Propionibacteriaceae bacterium]
GRCGGAASWVLRLDVPGGGWVDDHAPIGAETINKIRSGPARNSGVDRLWAFYETPRDGQRFLISREVGTGWNFESVPLTEADYDDPVGGRGLGISLGGSAGSRILAGASYNWRGDRPGRLFEMQPTGAWIQVRSNRPSLMWELEFDDRGRLWEFWNDFGQSGAVSRVYVNGIDKGESPGRDISSACWFKGHMYVVGALSGGASQSQRNRISRSTDGSSWGPVHTFQSATKGDHVVVIPRGDGELWATGHNPFEVAWTLDGVTWTREASLPSFPTHEESNHRTAVVYWRGAVWIFGRDQTAGTCRVFTDWLEDGEPPGPTPGPTPPPSDGGFFPSLSAPPKPPELPIVPVEPTQPTTKAADVFPKGEQPPMQKWVEQADRFVDETSLKFDAIITKWVDEFIRVMKDSWVKLGTLVGLISGRIEVLEARISDTYTWGSGSITVDKPIALPLRVVRDEEFVEMAIAADTPSTSGAVEIELRLNDGELLRGALSAGADFVVVPAIGTANLSKDSKLAVITRAAGEGTKGVVVQARCR